MDEPIDCEIAVIRDKVVSTTLKTRTKNHARQDKTNVQWVSPDDKPHYGVEALIATISDERELLKELKKAIKHNSEFAKRRTSQKPVPADP